ncbi:Uncharacterized protein APZ42_007924 [Daphnia magna]|uniref:Uncharacterized protein n=1 Tax=Daphnia magna TaxID=35525 RepID=A0A164EZS7_9CRUS|nr:Uncharacterized protein APZ42_007924 [Daphnia magna]
MVDNLLATANLTLPAVPRRHYESDGVRADPPEEPIESILQQSPFEAPTQPC